MVVKSNYAMKFFRCGTCAYINKGHTECLRFGYTVQNPTYNYCSHWVPSLENAIHYPDLYLLLKVAILENPEHFMFKNGRGEFYEP